MHFKMMLRRQFSTWIKTYADLPQASRLENLQKTILGTYGGDDASKHSLADDLSRSKHAMRTAFTLRTDISSAIKEVKDKNDKVKALKSIDKSVQEWLGQALSLDCLEHRRITFDHSSGLTLERVARGESVHRVRSLSELKRRLHDGKRCYGFFHPSMEAEPLVFVHIALTTQLCPSLSALDAFKEEQQPSHAMFYSINSPHPALRGLDMASLLIKETAQALQEAHPTLNTFSTLSPLPSLISYLSKGITTAPPSILQGLQRALGLQSAEVLPVLVQLLSDPAHTWTHNLQLCSDLQLPLMQLGAHYIAKEKRSSSEGLVPIDDVARFHLRNGAIFHALNWMGNPSAQGLDSAAGIMVNYLYDFNTIQDNAKCFGQPHSQLPVGSQVQQLLLG